MANIKTNLKMTKARGSNTIAGSQNSLYAKSKKIVKDKTLKEELEQVKNIIKKNLPYYSEEDITCLLQEIEKRGCSYVCAASIIFEQINNEKEFEQIFGFKKCNKKGELNHDLLIAELYSFMKDKIELNIEGDYITYMFDSPVTAAKDLLKQEFSTASDAVIALTNAGYEINGKKYTKFENYKKTMYGNYRELAKELLEEKAEDITNIIDFDKALRKEQLAFRIKEYNNAEKFSGLLGTNFEKWLNYYFQSKGIEKELKSESFKLNNLNIISKLEEYIENDYSIAVGITPGDDINMSDGTWFGNFNFSNVKHAGHVMPLVGVDDELNFVVSAWGKNHIITKPYVGMLNFYARKIVDKELELKEEPLPEEFNDVMEMSKEEGLKGYNIYTTIDFKLKELNFSIKTGTTFILELEKRFNQLFTEEEKKVVQYIYLELQDTALVHSYPLHLIAINVNGEYQYKGYFIQGFLEISRENLQNLLENTTIVNGAEIPGFDTFKRS